MVRKILVATTNPGKMAELSVMLDADVQWLSLSDFPNIPKVVEDGKTFAENARKKALGYARATGVWTIADDSGLVVDALDGDPGIKSARFCCKNRPEIDDRKIIDRQNIEKVLSLLQNVPTEKRSARFVCSLCLVRSGKISSQTEGELEGLIAEQPEGENGFGYDPIFYLAEKKKTTAQLTAEQKNEISHRSIAIKKLKPLLDELLRKQNLS